MSEVQSNRKRAGRPAWFMELKHYAKADAGKSTWQLINTLLPYLILWAVMILLLRAGFSFWLLLPLTVLAGGFLIRIFIIFHDCCHGSFYKSRSANRIAGYITGILTFTPFEQWRKSHTIHHATVANLDRRGVGDVWTMTVEEFRQADPLQRFLYRIVRTPVFTFLIGPPLMFFFVQRLASKDAGRAERNSVIITNLALAGILALAHFTIGLRTYALIQLPTMYVASVAGVWLFYVQHQFEGVYWARQGDWNPIRASLDGSSYYQLPAVLQWFTGSIGFHHLHHLNPRIPNYRLEAAYRSVPEVHVQPLTLRGSLRSLRLNLYDEERKQMVSFRHFQ